MPYMMARASVEDYASFRTSFDSAEGMRAAAGALSSAVYQSVDDPNEVVIHVEFPTVEAAKAFEASEELREAQQRGGVTAPPRTLVVNET